MVQTSSNNLDTMQEDPMFEPSPFGQRRQNILSALASNCGDKSRKGSVDARALGVISIINRRSDMYTTSSCSGRISIFGEPTEEGRRAGKKGGEWVYASHDPADEEEVLTALHSRCGSGAKLVFRFEPFLLHAECRDMAAAGPLLQAARVAGFRESGATLGASGARVMAGIRCSLRLEVPLADQGRQLVDDAYVRYLVRFANEKFAINTARIQRLEQLLAELPAEAPAASLTPSSNGNVAKGTRRHQQAQRNGVQNGQHDQPTANAAHQAPTHLVAPSRKQHQFHASKRKAQGGPDGAAYSLKERQVAVLRRVLALEQQLKGGAAQSQQRPWRAAGQHQQRQQVTSTCKQEPAGQKASSTTRRPGSVISSATQAATKPAHAVGDAAGPQHPAPPAAKAMAVQPQDQARGSGLTWREVPVKGQDQGFDPSTVLRWGAAGIEWGGKLVVVGGYGGAGSHARRADALIYDPLQNTTQQLSTAKLSDCSQGAIGDNSQLASGSWRVVEPRSADGPSPRMGHAAVLLGGVDTLVIVGGRSSPSRPLSDTWLLHIPSGTWIEIRPTVVSSTSAVPSRTSVPPAAGSLGSSDPTPSWPARYRHTAVAVPPGVLGGAGGAGAEAMQVHSMIIVFGGRGEEGVLGDMWALARYQQHASGSSGSESGHMCSWAWVEVQRPDAVGGDGSAWPSPRKSHATAVQGRYMYMHGGTSAYGSHLSDLWCLDLPALVQYVKAALATGSNAEAVPNPVNLWQSLTSARPTGGLGCTAPACFSHTLTAWGTSRLILCGGYPTEHHDRVYVYDVGASQWHAVPVTAPIKLVPATLSSGQPVEAGPHSSQGAVGRTFLPLRHCAALLPAAQPKPSGAAESGAGQQEQELVVAGGGAFCFSFGSLFSPVFALSLSQLAAALEAPGPSSRDSVKVPQDFTRKSVAGAGGTPSSSGAASGFLTPAVPANQGRSNKAGPSMPSPNGVAGAPTSGVSDWVLLLPAKAAKPVKDALKAAGWLDGSRKAGVVEGTAVPHTHGSSHSVTLDAQAHQQSQPMVALPLMPDAATQLQAAAAGAPRTSPAVPAVVLSALRPDIGGRLVQLERGKGPRAESASPHARMAAAVKALLQGREIEQKVEEELLRDLPAKWERLQDLVLIPAESMRGDAWERAFPTPTHQAALWPAIAKALGGSRLARQARVAETGTRDSRAVLLTEDTSGQGAWVSHREGGVIFVLDVTLCMFSSGNNTERTRMARLPAPGEVVVDLYTGIGYYTLPILVHAGVAKVYACEWNPHAIEGLKRGLAANGVESRCEVREGDCRAVAPVGVADRVLLGLLPQSTPGWATALAALREDAGGWLHVHCNALDLEEGACVEAAVSHLSSLLEGMPGRSGWKVTLTHVERVKWYAPRIRHLVLDIEVRPPHYTAQPSPQHVRPQPAAHSVSAAAAPGSLRSHPISDQSSSLGRKDVPPPSHLPGMQRVAKVGAGQGGVQAAAHPAASGPGARLKGNPSTQHQLQGAPVASDSVVGINGVSGTKHTDTSRQPQLPWWQWPHDQLPAVHVVDDAARMSREEFEAQVKGTGAPAVLKGLDIGPCTSRWTAEHLMAGVSHADMPVAVHVTHDESGALDFVGKNFSYRTMPFAELVGRVSGCGGPYPSVLSQEESGTPRSAESTPHAPVERYYLRSLGTNPRKEPAHLEATFPELAADVALPPLYPPDALFSTVLRISSPGLRLWTHFVRGVKRVLLWPPHCAGALYTDPEGSSSPVTRLEDPDLRQYPRFAELPPPLVCTLHPGDVLYIPALWHHNVTTLTDDSKTKDLPCASSAWSISVNVFFKHLPPDMYLRKDLYGNRDPAPAEAACEAARSAGKELSKLPEPYRSFYRDRAVQVLDKVMS